MPSNQNELVRLINMYCNGKMSPADIQRLETMLRGNIEAQRLFIRYMDIHARLCWEFGARLSTEQKRASQHTFFPGQTVTSPLFERRKPSRTSSRRRGPWPRLLMVSLAAAIVFVAATVILPTLMPSIVSDDATPLHPHQNSPVTLVQSIAARWDGSADYRSGEEIPFGRVELLNGLAVLETGTNAALLLEAPVSMELVDSGTAFLYSGRIVVRCEAPDGFVVNTDAVEVTDKGTEFGVSAGPSGDAIIQVYEGKVLANFKTSPHERGRKMNLFAGEAYGITLQAGSQPHKLPFKPDMFIRTLPEPDDQTDFKPAFQTQNRIETIHIMPAPSHIIVDGDLSDWDRGGEFIGRFDPPYGDTYNVKGYMMYDQEYLYIGAHVRDPAPMRSIIPPEADRKYCYRGGAIQVRLCTDPSEPYPLPQYLWPNRVPRISPEARLESFMHLNMWYYAPENRPCLLINYGFPPLQSLPGRPKGWQGAYQMDSDELGYTLEYMIPWRLIQQDGVRFQPGDETGLCWQVNWSDQAGQVRIAQLNECVNLANIKNISDLKNSWRMSASWGRGLFMGKEN